MSSSLKVGRVWLLGAGAPVLYCLVVHCLVVQASPVLGYPFFLERLDTQEEWDSIALGSSGIKYVVPGPAPEPGPDGELVPGAVELPCLDFVLYGPGIQHISIIKATGLDCVEDLDNDLMNRMRRSMAQFAGYIARMPDPAGDGFICGVTVHNDLFTGPPVITPENISYILRQIRLTFNESVLGRLVYLPTSERAWARVQGWLDDSQVEIDFEIYDEDPGVTPEFLRGDATASGRVSVSDPLAILVWLFMDASRRPSCLDAADANDDGVIDLHDPMLLLRFLFQGGPPPSPPFPEPGLDPTGDELGDCSAAV